MVDGNLVGSCGFIRGSCIIYRAGKDSKHLTQKVSQESNRTPEEIRREGCQSVLMNGWKTDQSSGKYRKTVQCLKADGLDLCYERSVFPQCKRSGEPTDSCLKHGEDPGEKLNKIEPGKTDERLEEDWKWTCRKCEKPISIRLTDATGIESDCKTIVLEEH